MKHFPFALLALAALVAQPSGTVSDPDAYAVYNAVIPSDSLVHDAHPTELLIQDTTEGHPQFLNYCFPDGSGLPGPWQDVLTNYREQNITAKLLTAQLSLPVASRLETKSTIQGFFASPGSGGWTAFNAAHPDAKGYLQVSAVGFDKSHERAMVYTGHSCGGLCGEGTFHYLERTDGGWREVRLAKNCMWAS